MVRATIAEQLPPELYGDIVDCLPDDNIQQDLLSFTRALPFAPIPLERLFRNIRLSAPIRVVQFYSRIRKDADARGWVRTLSLETWEADADVVINILAQFPRLRELRLFMGPNFSPDHLEEIFIRPKAGLELLSLRFRPYVQRATYYQFLAGAYFDSLIFALAKWPASSIPTLSIIQDPLDPTIAPTKFAQPFVFHRLDPFSTLCRAPSMDALSNFRLRVPSRQISRFIYQPHRSFPALKLLDLSTCDVRGVDVEAILGRFTKLEHLILDKCNLITQKELPEGGADSQWAAIGKIMALSGVKRTKDREKKVKAWLEATAEHSEPTTESSSRASKAKRGRKGLATATISLRETATPEAAPVFVEGGKTAKELGFKPGTRIHVLPPKPKLTSVAISLPAHANRAQLTPEVIRAEFERGWAEGISQLVARRNRLKTSWYNGVARVVQFEDTISHEEDDKSDDDGGGAEYGLSGLKEIDNDDERTFSLGMDVDRCPVLCLAGSTKLSEEHVENCGHLIGRDVWFDEL
ncbi:hypothetical protein BXZ70DRAFT_903215 [Cristinia sonorae]|uniref:Uncharacterized protein n=1 Tax=Cristinia sonorae TaxID=1940300 RepID=A0A8K0XUN0_9AGAR|nr:hypothetical protein BXZ70DRAFT_903215 [Cristinia sonorae]